MLLPVRLSGSHRPSQGTVLRASVLARLFGIRLLRLDADIALVPADFESSVHVDPPHRSFTSHALEAGAGDLGDAARLLAHASRTLDES